MQETTSPNDQCPNLTGIYSEYGESPFECPGYHEKCLSLSFNLLSGNIGYQDIMDEGIDPLFPHGNHVEIQQEDDEKIEITLWLIYGNDKQLVHRETLKLQQGDYECVEKRMRLVRSIYYLWGFSNVLGTEIREFSKNEMGDLVIHIQPSYFGHHTIVPFAISREAWVRFQSQKTQNE